MCQLCNTGNYLTVIVSDRWRHQTITYEKQQVILHQQLDDNWTYFFQMKHSLARYKDKEKIYEVGYRGCCSQKVVLQCKQENVPNVHKLHTQYVRVSLTPCWRNTLMHEVFMVGRRMSRKKVKKEEKREGEGKGIRYPDKRRDAGHYTQQALLRSRQHYAMNRWRWI